MMPIGIWDGLILIISKMKILTFDIEDWFHCDMISDISTWSQYKTRIHESLDKILLFLSENDQKATFFVLGWMAEKYPEIIHRIKKENHEIGCHSYKHELVYKMTKSQFKQDTEKSIKYIEDCTGEKVTLYRAPAFSITKSAIWAFEVLSELGIEFDCSVFPAERDYGGFSTFKLSEPAIIKHENFIIKEFPMNYHHIFNKRIIFSGGGYFRMVPYFLIKNWILKSDYVMSYFHPRDFDFKQPMLKHLPFARKVKSYYGLKNSFSKFKKLISDFNFVSINEASKIIDWNHVKTIEL